MDNGGSSNSPREPFESDAASLQLAHDAPSPALSSSNASARFEFEAGRGAAGSKILMVEWSAPTAPGDGPWEVSWEGKSTVVASAETGSGATAVADEGEGETTAAADAKPQRLYFLLPPSAPIPRLIHISRRSPAMELQTNPLPAIFPPALGASARAAGRKGVLHTRWAKRRVAVLEGEIEREGNTNAEGIALEMAVREKEWIEENFGVGKGAGGGAEGVATPPVSPVSPVRSGGRLAERMKGLKLGTSAVDLGARPAEEQNPLSPETSDVAIGAPAFSLFHAPAPTPTSALGATPGPVPGLVSIPAPARAVAQSPPLHIIAQQEEAGDRRGMNSLDAVAEVSFDKVMDTAKKGKVGEEDGDDDELFAVTMNPRSPEMARSPFSLVSEEVIPWR